MKVTQLSIFLENKPGHLENVLQVLKNGQINIITLTIAETADFGILRMIINDPSKGEALLKQNGFTCSTTDVLAIQIDDTPGSLHQAIETFARRKLNIEYMYAFTEKRDDKAVMIFRFDNADLAAKALLEEGYALVKNNDLIGQSK